MKFDIIEFVDKTCLYGISLQAKSGEMPPGKNGPHCHNMTGVRTTAHWAILFLYAYKLTENNRYRDCANAAYDALLSTRYHQFGGSFRHRQENFKSSYNGLIGQAWTLESLYYGYSCLGRKDLFNNGKDLVLRHRFSEKLGLWRELDIDGSIREVGQTLNQQIWFTAMASFFLDTDSPIPTVFLDALPKNSVMRSPGLFYTGVAHRNRLHQLYSAIRKLSRNLLFGDSRLGIDSGYHLFTMVGLSLLHQKCSNHKYFKSRGFKKALLYTFSSTYGQLLRKSIFGYQYNVPGFEYPFVYDTFQNWIPEEALDIVIDSMKYQFAAHLDHHSQLLVKSTVDPMTLVARTYEIYRIPFKFWNDI